MPNRVLAQQQRKLKIGGRRNIAAGGDITGNTIVTGDGNTITINQGTPISELVEALRKGGLWPHLTTRLSEAAFKQLLGLLSTIKLSDAEHWFRLYRTCLPVGANLVNSTIPALLVTDLCLHPITESWPPLFEFVERLALQAKAAPFVPALRAWIDTNSDHVMPPVPIADIMRLRKQVRTAHAETVAAKDVSYLQIYLEPDRLNRTQQRKQLLFNVELVLWSATTNEPFVLQSDPLSSQQLGNSWTLDELPDLLDSVFANPEYVALIPDITRLVIEIVAPSTVFSYGFERWKHKRDAIETYGIHYPLVVRLQDRHTIPNPADQARADTYWRQKWKFFREEMAARTADHLFWLAKKELENSKITKIQLQKKDDVPCLGISLPILPEKSEVFELIGYAGIPVALWMRGGVAEINVIASVYDIITPLVKGKTLDQLRSLLQEIRVNALADEKNFANFLTLLWDDPTRLPYKYAEQGVLV